MLDVKDLAGDLNVIDFKINIIGEPVLSVDFNQVALDVTGVANPENTAVDLVAYEYSLDNGVTWVAMTSDSVITGLTYSPTGTANSFVWNIKEDLGNAIYNTAIKIRFRAQATFGATTVLTDYKVRSIYLSKETVQTELRPESIFPTDYSGTFGSDMLKNAPKP